MTVILHCLMQLQDISAFSEGAEQTHNPRQHKGVILLKHAKIYGLFCSLNLILPQIKSMQPHAWSPYCAESHVSVWQNNKEARNIVKNTKCSSYQWGKGYCVSLLYAMRTADEFITVSVHILIGEGTRTICSASPENLPIKGGQTRQSWQNVPNVWWLSYRRPPPCMWLFFQENTYLLFSLNHPYPPKSTNVIPLHPLYGDHQNNYCFECSIPHGPLSTTRPLLPAEGGASASRCWHTFYFTSNGPFWTNTHQATTASARSAGDLVCFRSSLIEA